MVISVYIALRVGEITSALPPPYFTAADRGHVLSEELRGRVEFQERNLLSSPFEVGFDLILCRNVVIYFAAEVKRALVQRFRTSLKPGGVLLLGATESLLGDEAAGLERLATNFYHRSASTPEVASERAA